MNLKIYALLDPRNNEIRYIGFTKGSLKDRLKDHIHTAKKRTTHKHKWITSLLEIGLKPIMLEIESVTLENWQEREKYWISFYRDQLTNSTDGGEGLINPSEDTRKRISEKTSDILKGNKRRKGVPHTEESKKAISEGMLKSEKFKKGIANRPNYQSLEENRKKMSDSTKWIRKTEEHKKNIKEAMKISKKVSDAAEKRKGIPHPESSRQKKLGRKWINNGIESKQLDKNEQIPEGYAYGMLKKSKP